ncbi:hypothetical protein [Frondihabitans australicus]|uniref:Uncharacterized protein n=1 Tax=Frondihabitans australicus TaxID=386892 RepID=A0A495IKV0_9MICO|nr:hypothetical protein [Frondihabitans australicus]RKR76409.1 hypothetical protein C8E83_3582 [Frondihabitans australicus]
MAKVKVTPSAYSEVSATLDGAVRALSTHVHEASSSLAGTGSMSGTDIHGRTWGADYDRGATQLFRALTSLSGAIARVSAAVQITGENHAGAEAASSGSGAVPRSGPTTFGDTFSAPPSAIGGDGKAKPEGWELVASVIESVWPTADVFRMGQAAAAWSSLGDGLRAVRSQHVSGASAPLDGMTSSELPGLRGTVKQLAAQLTKLAEFCDSMQSFLTTMIATDVAAWAATTAILVSLVAAVAATSAAGLGLTVFTFGISDAVAAGADAGEVATASAAVVAEGLTVEAAVGAATGTVETVVIEASEELIAEIESIFETMVIEDPELVQIGALPWIAGGAAAVGGLTAIAPPTAPSLAPGKGSKVPRNDPTRIPYALPSGAEDKAEGKWITQKQPRKDDKTLVLYYNPKWKPFQIAQASKKARQLNAIAATGQLVATVPPPRVNAVPIYNADHGLPLSTPHPGQDVDHIHELQLGGNPIDPTNLQLLDSSVNRSIGAQIAAQIKRDAAIDPTKPYTRVIIIDPPLGVAVPPGDKPAPQ